MKLNLALVMCLFMVQASFAADSYQLGSELYRQGDYGPAASFFEDSIKKKGPNRAFARYLLGNCYVQLNRKEDAIKQYRESYRLSPKGPQARHCLTALKSLYSKPKAQSPRSEVAQVENVQEAEGIPDPKALKQNTVDATLKKAYELEQSGNYSASEKSYIAGLYQAEKLGSRSEHLLNSLDALSGFYMGRQKYHKAIKIYQRQLKVTQLMRGRDSTAALDCKRSLGQAYQSSGDLGTARQYYQECVYGWQVLFQKYERSHTPSLANSKGGLVGAYSDMANLLNQLGDFNGSDKYTQLANSLGQ